MKQQQQQQQQQQCPPKHHKKVWFGKVELIEFPIILGDNPTPDDGFPITIGWEPQRTDNLEIDYFEMFYQRHRHGMDLFIDVTTRAELAIKGGASIRKVPFIDWPMYFRTHQNLKNNKQNNKKTTATTSKRRKGLPRRGNNKMRLADEHMLTLHHATMIST